MNKLQNLLTNNMIIFITIISFIFTHKHSKKCIFWKKVFDWIFFMVTHLRHPFNCTKHRKMCSHALLPYSFCDTFYFVVFLVWQQLLDWTCFCWKLLRAMPMSRINKLPKLKQRHRLVSWIVLYIDADTFDSGPVSEASPWNVYTMVHHVLR